MSDIEVPNSETLNAATSETGNSTMLRSAIRYAKRPYTQLCRKLQADSTPLYSTAVREEFQNMFGNLALQALVDHFPFDTVLDVGSGAGRQAAVLERYGKKVTAIDLGVSTYYEQRRAMQTAMTASYSEHTFAEEFDCVWASHVLEHQPNPGLFLKKIHSDVREDGIVCITVPPRKEQIVGGHLTLWNAGLLIYNLVLAQFDCRDIHVRKYAYNISVILRKRTIELPSLHYDTGDIARLSAFFPEGLSEGFNGDISRWNWPWSP